MMWPAGAALPLRTCPCTAGYAASRASPLLMSAVLWAALAGWQSHVWSCFRIIMTCNVQGLIVEAAAGTLGLGLAAQAMSTRSPRAQGPAPNGGAFT